MIRRYDSLSRMLLTLLVALLVGAVLEADGLQIWAERLKVGTLRDYALPAATAWHEVVAPLGVGRLRSLALEAKAELAPVMTGEHVAVASPEVPAASSAVVAVAPISPVAQSTPAAVVVLSAAASAVPAAADPLAMNKPLLPIGGAEDGKLVRIALAGDSMMAVGLAPTLTRGFAAEKAIRVVKAYRSGTGLARPEVFDWLQQYPQMLGDGPPNLIICSLGANDAQNVQVGKKVLEFGSQDWDEFYRGRLSAYLDMLGKQRTPILWVGMPVMRDKHFAQKMQHMNELVQSELPRYPNVTWLDPNPALGYTSMAFAQYRPDARGKLIKMRADDGIHMTDDGAVYLLPPIREWVERNVSAATELPRSSAQVIGVQVAERTDKPL